MPHEQARAIMQVVRGSHAMADVATTADLREYASTIGHDLEKLKWGVHKEFALMRKDVNGWHAVDHRQPFRRPDAADNEITRFHDIGSVPFKLP